MAPAAPRSILKKTRPPTDPAPASPPTTPPTSSPLPTAPPPSTKPTPEEARRIALSHAHAIQIQKSLELSILESIETLLDFPTPNVSTQPSHPDIKEFKHHLRYMQPTDYDSLIEERNIIDKCGYTLCPHPRKRLNKDKLPSKYALVDKGLKTMRFVERESLERFCSDRCARNGLWIRVQLREDPSWLRHDIVKDVEVGEDGSVSGLNLGGGGGGIPEHGSDIMLLDEAEMKRQHQQSSWNKSAEGDLKKLVEELAGLGIESRDLLKSGGDTSGSNQVSVTIAERVSSPSEAKAPSSEDLDNKLASLSIEGYTPRKAPDEKGEKIRRGVVDVDVDVDIKVHI